jgi:hypothetical protein
MKNGQTVESFQWLTFFVNEKEWFDGCFGLAAPSDRRFLLPLY